MRKVGRRKTLPRVGSPAFSWRIEIHVAFVDSDARVWQRHFGGDPSVVNQPQRRPGGPSEGHSEVSEEWAQVVPALDQRLV